jgi:hypothetical protein
LVVEATVPAGSVESVTVDREALPDVTLDWLTCIECVRRVQVRDAEGWVLVERSVEDGDPWDDAVWKCPDCVTASDEYFAEQRWQRALATAESDEG